MASFIGTNMTCYYVAESTEGTTPNAATYSPISQHADVKATQITRPTRVIQSGTYDPTGFGKAPTYTEVRVTGSIGPDFQTFIKTYFRSDTSVTFVAKNGTQFIRVVGAKVKSHRVFTTNQPDATPINYELVFWAWTGMVFTESGGSPTYGSITAGFRNWSDVTTFSPGGATTIWRSFDLTIENILRIVYDNTGAVNAIKRGPSSINGQFVLTDDFTNQEYTDLQAATTHTFAITITGLTYSITNSVWDTVARDVPIDDLILKTVTLMGGTPTLS